jgi:hypothetical protein
MKENDKPQKDEVRKSKFTSTLEAKESLSESSKVFILANFDKINLDELAKRVFNDRGATGQTYEGRAIKEILISNFGKDVVSSTMKTTKFIAAGEIELTDSHKKFIEKNANSMRPLECTRTLFNDITLTQLSREARAVIKYMKELGPNIVMPEDDCSEEYTPVTSVARLVARVNKYIQKNSDPLKSFLDPKELKQADIRNLNALLGYMRNYRFLYQISQYKNTLDRDLFESTFIEFLYNKPDCLEEDIHNYISLCTEIVSIAQIERTIQLINDKYNEILNGSSDEKMSVTLAETLDKMRQRQKDAKDKYGKLMSMLVEDRAKRTEARAGGATLYNMVNLWKQKETREKMLDRADDRNKELEKEVERLSTLDQLKAEIYGLDPKTIHR